MRCLLALMLTTSTAMAVHNDRVEYCDTSSAIRERLHHFGLTLAVEKHADAYYGGSRQVAGVRHLGDGRSCIRFRIDGRQPLPPMPTFTQRGQISCQRKEPVRNRLKEMKYQSLGMAECNGRVYEFFLSDYDALITDHDRQGRICMDGRALEPLE